MHKKDLSDRRLKLIEKLGAFSEREEHLAPYAARILAMIILSGKEGATFDEIVCGLNIGKSTVSSHLEMLQESKRIEYYMKEGDRKRYFIVNKDTLKLYLKGIEKEWKERIEIYREVRLFQNDYNEIDNETSETNFDISYMDNFIDYAIEVKQSINRLIRKLELKKKIN